MPRKSYASYLMYFDLRSYLHELRREMKAAVTQLRDKFYEEAMRNVRNLPLKKNKVVMKDGTETSDYKRRGALINSIVTERVEWIAECSLRTAVNALVKNFKDSHIGIYYEFGTGEEAEDASRFSIGFLGDPNPFRKGKTIVTRSKHKNGGVWRDAGGNLRITRSPRGGDYDSGLREYIGEDIKAYHWFRNAFQSMEEEAVKVINDVFKKVSPLEFLHVRSSFVLGRD